MQKIIWIFLFNVTLVWASGQEDFLQYCGACHQLAYATPKHKPSIDPLDAQHWFLLEPPDLSLICLQHSKAWLKKYLLGFYDDSHHPFGRNNSVLKDVRMPDILGRAPDKEALAESIADYLDKVAQPEKPLREKIGLGVMLACFCLIVLTWLVTRK